MEDAPKLLNIPKSECPDGYVFHVTKGRNRDQTLKIQWFLPNDSCTVTHLLPSCARDRLRKFCWDQDGKKCRIGECLFVHRKNKEDLCCRYTRMTLKWLEESTNMAPMWIEMMKNVDLDWECTRRECKPHESIIEEHHSTGNYFRRFLGILELISRFAFDFSRCGFFLMIRIFGVFGAQSHEMRLYMCMCCGQFAPTQFHFACFCVFDNS